MEIKGQDLLVIGLAMSTLGKIIHEPDFDQGKLRGLVQELILRNMDFMQLTLNIVQELEKEQGEE